MWENEQKLKFFLACLLALLAGQPSFRFMIGLASLTIGLAIGGTELTIGKVVIGFSKWFLWNKLISFLKCCIAEIGS